MKQILFVLLLLMPVLTNAQTASFISTTDTVCQDSCIKFINTSTGTIDSIRWFIRGITLPNPHSDTLTACFLSAGHDSVKLYVYDSGRVDSSMQVVSIKQMPHPMLIDTLPYFYGTPCGLYVRDIYTSYEWYFINVTTFTDGDTTNYTPGTYSSLAFVVVDSNGCFGRSDSLGRCVESVKNISNLIPFMNIFPNPTSDELTITGNYTIYTISISNLLGQTVYTHEYNTEKVQVDVADLPAGLYLIRINGTEVRKFVKE